MPKIKFENKVFRGQSIEMIERALVIIDDFKAQGFILTLRQVYYQFISRDQFPENKRYKWTGSKWVRDVNGTKNCLPNYKWLTTLVSDARLSGIIDWNDIEDRVRNLKVFASWESPEQITEEASLAYQIDLWKNQNHYLECWVEKEALIGVVSKACSKWRVNHIACKGYMSLSEIWDAGWNRIRGKKKEGKQVTVIHLGDHDPSGIDMTRDIEARMGLFARSEVEILRIALNMDQIEEYDPPPSPAKETDSRFKDYMERFGEDSWELDALSPTVVVGLIEKEILERLDVDLWNKDRDEEQDGKDILKQISDNFSTIQDFLNPDESITEGWKFE